MKKVNHLNSERIPEQFNIQKFQLDLMTWFQREKRDLPWRKDRDPYKIWVSEIMLQQTRVDTVIPYFNRFISRFPTPEALAGADEQEVLKEWEGLGYYSRARNLQSAVKEVVEKYDGNIPDNPAELGRLKGIGPYTKGAILSIAFNQPEPAVDGNVMRVLSRILYVEEDIAKASTKKLFEKLAREVISHDDPSSFNQGLMELGALICTPKNPQCMLCPVQEHCEAFHAGLEQTLPVKSKGKKQKIQPYYVIIAVNDHQEVLIEQRPKRGLLAGLYQFPMAPAEKRDIAQLKNWFLNEYGLRINHLELLGHEKHVFSHLVWEMDIVKASLEGGTLSLKRASWAKEEELQILPFPVSHQKIMQYFQESTP
ncbi:A/G-specific adenine glycosylase [Melghiribacillus thermohalophilus]|uniref:A/G-specific adenine glycosylase n=1 Tax=Melghiribacillus thermohalophilus TaxID=1324956 RepID=UPI0010531AF9|nr:A/G-specific adenine glycosylase [Melghiribacillus thermohalophilus]